MTKLTQKQVTKYKLKRENGPQHFLLTYRKKYVCLHCKSHFLTKIKISAKIDDSLKRILNLPTTHYKYVAVKNNTHLEKFLKSFYRQFYSYHYGNIYYLGNTMPSLKQIADTYPELLI